MGKPPEFPRGQRLGLIVLAALGLIGVNAVFLYGALFVPGAYEAATSNPVAVAFMVEAALLVVALAWLFERWKVSRIGWLGFVGLALVGSLAFAVPVALLFPRRES